MIVINERFERKGFEELAGYVREFDPSISRRGPAGPRSDGYLLPENPTLIFSPALIRHMPKFNGRFFCGYPFSKSEEYGALEKAGIPVPKWTLLPKTISLISPDLMISLSKNLTTADAEPKLRSFANTG